MRELLEERTFAKANQI